MSLALRTTSPWPYASPRTRAAATIARTLLRIGCALVWLLPVTLAGCQHADLAQERAERRMTRLGTAPKLWAESESSRPRRLAHSAEYVAWYFEHEVDCFDHNLDNAGMLIERDVRRGGERLPRDGAKALELMYGKPERIERNAIILFF